MAVDGIYANGNSTKRRRLSEAYTSDNAVFALKAKNRILELRVLELQRELEIAKIRRQDVEKRFQNQESSSESEKVAELTNKLEKVWNMFKTKEETFKTDYANLQEDHESLREGFDDLKSENRRLRDDLERTNTESAQDLGYTRTEKEDLQVQVRALLSENEMLKDQKLKLRDHARDVTAERNRLKNIEAQKMELQKQIDEFKANAVVEGDQNLIDELRANLADRNEMERKCILLKKQADEATEKLGNQYVLDDRNRSLEEDARNLKKKCRELTGQVENLKAHRNDNTHWVQQLSTVLDHVQYPKDVIRAIQALQETRLNLITAEGELQLELSRKGVAEEDASRQISELTYEVKHAKEKLGTLTKRVLETEVTVRTLRKQNERNCGFLENYKREEEKRMNGEAM